jgi:hypothetical protein
MADDDDRSRVFFDRQPAKCKLCKKKERTFVGPERGKMMIDRADRWAKEAATLTRDQVLTLKTIRAHMIKACKGEYCENCVVKTELWFP